VWLLAAAFPESFPLQRLGSVSALPSFLFDIVRRFLSFSEAGESAFTFGGACFMPLRPCFAARAAAIAIAATTTGLKNNEQ